MVFGTHDEFELHPTYLAIRRKTIQLVNNEIKVFHKRRAVALKLSLYDRKANQRDLQANSKKRAY